MNGAAALTFSRNVARRRNRGFTLVEMLVVVAVVGIIAAMAAATLLSAGDRSKQKRTMADLRAIAVAVEAYAIDETRYPVAATMPALLTSIDPIYIRQAPGADGWGHDLTVAATAAGYTIGSQGKDGGGGLATCAGAPTCGKFTDAIIFINGEFAQWPEGMQQQ